MAVIDFIKTDTERYRGARASALGAGLAAGAVAIGLLLGWRDDYAGTVDAATVLPAVAMAGALASAPWCLSTPRLTARFRAGVLSLIVMLILGISLASPTLPRSVTEFATARVFWRECGKCWLKGTLFGSLLGLGLTAAWWRWLPLPDRRTRCALAALAGSAGVLILALHCSKTAPSHLLVGHWGQALFVFGPLFWLQNRLAAARLARVLGDSQRSLRQLDRL